MISIAKGGALTSVIFAWSGIVSALPVKHFHDGYGKLGNTTMYTPANSEIFDKNIAASVAKNLEGFVGKGLAIVYDQSFYVKTNAKKVPAVSDVSEPGGLALFACGLAGLWLMRKKVSLR